MNLVVLILSQAHDATIAAATATTKQSKRSTTSVLNVKYCTTFFYEATSSQKRSDMASVAKKTHTYTRDPRIYRRLSMSDFAFAVIESGRYLPTPGGWKAKLAQALQL